MHHLSYVARIVSPFYFLNTLTGFLCGDALEGRFLLVPRRAGALAPQHQPPHYHPLHHHQLHRGSPKRGREPVEVTFVHKALSLGFEVAQPYDDSECYDFILESQDESPDQPVGGFWRVLVKSTNRLRKGGYVVGACHFSARGAKQFYTAEQIDVLVVCIVPEETWYVIPVKEFAPREYLSFFPQNTGSKGQFERFREAWHLMGAPITRDRGTSPPCPPRFRETRVEHAAETDGARFPAERDERGRSHLHELPGFAWLGWWAPAPSWGFGEIARRIMASLVAERRSKTWPHGKHHTVRASTGSADVTSGHGNRL